MANIKKIIEEEGVVIEKIFKEATNAFNNRDGKLVDAQPERYIVVCVSGDSISPDTGIKNSNVQEYKVSREEFLKFKYLQKVDCKYEFSTYGCKPISVSPLKI